MVSGYLRFLSGTANRTAPAANVFVFAAIVGLSIWNVTRSCAHVRLSRIGCSKESDYLIDNRCALMLSRLKERGKKKVDGPLAQFQTGNSEGWRPRMFWDPG